MLIGVGTFYLRNFGFAHAGKGRQSGQNSVPETGNTRTFGQLENSSFSDFRIARRPSASSSSGFDTE